MLRPILQNEVAVKHSKRQTYSLPAYLIHINSNYPVMSYSLMHTEISAHGWSFNFLWGGALFFYVFFMDPWVEVVWEIFSLVQASRLHLDTNQAVGYARCSGGHTADTQWGLAAWHICLPPQSLTWNLKSWWFPSSESPVPGVDFQVNHVKLQGCTL